jgi:hypothetical protein
MGKAYLIIRIALILALAWYRGIMEILCDVMNSPSVDMRVSMPGIFLCEVH